MIINFVDHSVDDADETPHRYATNVMQYLKNQFFPHSSSNRFLIILFFRIFFFGNLRLGTGTR